MAHEQWRRFVVPRGSRYRSPGEIHVEGDASSASYFIALGAIAAHGGAPLRIEGVGSDSIQGDIRFVDAATAMGAKVQTGPGWLQVSRGAWPLRALTLDCNHIPDAAMTLAVMALYADGPTRLTNIASWRVKETDRIAAMATELRKLGATVVEGADFIEVQPPAHWQHAAIHTYDDHRMAMCLSLAAFNGLAGGARRAGAHPRPALRGQDLPRLLRDAVRRGQRRRRRRAGDHRRRAHRVGQGHAGRGAGRAAGLPHAGLRLAVPQPPRWRRCRTASRPTTRRRWPGWRRGWTCASTAPPWCCAAEPVNDELRREDVGSLASRIAALPAVREALHGLQLAFRRAPGLVADGRDMGTVVFPARRAQGVSHRQRRTARGTPA